MEAWKRMLVCVACSGLFISGFPGAGLQVAAQQAVMTGSPEATAKSEPPKPGTIEKPVNEESTSGAPIAELPDSPGVIAKAGKSPKEPIATESRWELASAAQQSGQSQSSTSQQSDSNPQKPVGTAAAEAPNASGVAASQPAGVAIAPAKQRRVRTIVIRTGAILAAGVAVGAVVALTAATPSKPPGAH